MPNTKPNRVYHPRHEEIPSGLCECGCGDPTPLATYTNRRLRYFRGHPRPFIPQHGLRKGCDAPCGPDHHLFVGRRVRDGYVYIYRPEHPRALTRSTWKGYVLEHRVVWEEANGRLLRDDECVHHINGVRDDNRPDNLVALTRACHQSLHASGRTVSAETRHKLSESQTRVWKDRRLQADSQS
jgi:hypothetical protein